MRTMARFNVIAIGTLFILIVASGCVLPGTAVDSDSKETSGKAPLLYLQEEIPVCIPVAGSQRDLDPCAVRGVPNLPSFYVEYARVPNYWDLYFDLNDPPSMVTPHLVIRATFLPDTTRCSVYDREVPAFVPFDLSGTEMLMCFTDARVNDYLIATGPPNITVATYNLVVGSGSVVDLERYARRVAEAYEGREGVLFLAPSPTTVVEAWRMTEFWDIQRMNDDATVVAPYQEYFEIWKRRFTAEDLALLERPLSEFETVIAEGAVARATETGGRIGVGDDLPMLITDANLLRPYYEGPGVGVSYETDAPVLPPPVPGGDGPVPSPITTGEEDGGSVGNRS